MYDAVLVPGGGLQSNGELPPYVTARLKRAAQLDASNYITLSAGTTHKPLTISSNGLPVYESIVAARALASYGVSPLHILSETTSYDTIGNAWFARVLHVDPLCLTKLHIITSDFHLARTEGIFRWVFGLTPRYDVELSFEGTANIGLRGEDLSQRQQKEQASLKALGFVIDRITSISNFHKWLNTEHAAYAWPLRDSAYRPLVGPLANTY